MNACREEEWRKEAADIPPSEVGNDSVFNQTYTGTVSRAALGKLLKSDCDYLYIRWLNGHRRKELSGDFCGSTVLGTPARLSQWD